jgi:thiamine biosynthesis lipoprotein
LLSLGNLRFHHSSPIAHELASVTVVAKNTATADALAMALMIMGPDKGYRYAQENNVAAYFIIRQGNIFAAQHTPLI